MTINITGKQLHKVVENNGNTIHYFISGNNDGETIVFLHPAFGDHRCFYKQIDYFSSNYQIITLDMLGHGLTGIGKSKDNITATTLHISEILKVENKDKAHIVGVSLGSLLAQDFALKYPEKVLSLTALGGYDINKVQKEIAKNQRKEIFKWLFKAIFSMEAFRRYAANIAVINEEERIHFYESAKHFTRKSFSVLRDVDKLIADRSIERTYPLLILGGEKDIEPVLKEANRWHNREQKNSKLFIIEKAGHCANMDNAEDFNEILMNFINNKEYN